MDDDDQLMGMNLIGRLANFSIAQDKPLMPVFEAISNSIQAINGAKGGEIIVRVHRRADQGQLQSEVAPLEPVVGFTIEDNGPGFNETNYASFRTADSRLKHTQGGKGVGRLSWLKVFEHAEIDSVFKDGDSFNRRKFTFEITPKGVENPKVEPTDAKGPRTSVKLVGFRPDYRPFPKGFDTIARKIIDHFLELFVLSRCPTIILDDEYGGDRLSLNRIYKDEVVVEKKPETVKINGVPFKLHHLRMSTRARDPEHQVHLCGWERSVEASDLSKHLVNLRGVLRDGDGDENGQSQFLYACYVSGRFLDERTNQERTRLNILAKGPTLGDEPTLEDILRAVAAKAEAFLKPYLSPIEKAKEARIRAYIQKRHRFRPLLNQPERLKTIRADLSDDDLDIELYRLLHQLEMEVRVEGMKLLDEPKPKSPKSLKDYQKRFERFLDVSNEVGQSRLAEYVVHRRAVIDFLVDCMKRDESGAFAKEDVVHDVIFPMKHTSNSIPNPDLSNLWMIDERLSYHYYLASDIRFSRNTEIQVAGEHKDERPDLLVLQPYDRPHAFVGETKHPFDCVTIVEFKRPMRDDFATGDIHKDPVKQVLEYVRKIRAGKARDKNGGFLKVGDGAQIYAYIICSIGPNLEALAEFYQFISMPDNLGYFGWHPILKVYTEILDYDKVIQDARKRNEVFFDKFNMPPMR